MYFGLGLAIVGAVLVATTWAVEGGQLTVISFWATVAALLIWIVVWVLILRPLRRRVADAESQPFPAEQPDGDSSEQPLEA